MNLPQNPYLDDLLRSYPATFENIIRSWEQDGPDAFWLMYSANYLCRVGSTRFAIDPLTLPARLGMELPISISSKLSPLELVLLSHDHSDHIQWGFLKAISTSVKQWIVPAWMEDQFRNEIPNPYGRVKFIHPGEYFRYRNIEIQTFAGNHWEETQIIRPGYAMQKGLPSLAYLFESASKRWFFPGDTRSFNSQNLPQTQSLFGLVAHVFLGRLASETQVPPLISDFVSYFSSLQPSQIILSHLYEVGRETKDIWTRSHADLLVKRFSEMDHPVPTRSAGIGDQINW